MASGAIDLGLEAELLERPDRLAAAEEHAARLLAAALARFDANRTAARDMRDVLGLADEPWLGVALQAAEVGPAADETKALVGEGADVVQVRVPASWEFAEARRQAGLETPGLFEVDERPGEGRTRSGARRSVGRLPIDAAARGDSRHLRSGSRPTSSLPAASGAWRRFGRRPTKRPRNAAATPA